jgi:hypothetical protein
MKQYLVAGLAGMAVAGGLISAAPPASAGCLYGGWMAASRCDGPVQPDGTWQRCMTYSNHNFIPQNSCAQMSADQPPWIPILMSPRTHIDDDLSN